MFTYILIYSIVLGIMRSCNWLRTFRRNPLPLTEDYKTSQWHSLKEHNNHFKICRGNHTSSWILNVMWTKLNLNMAHTLIRINLRIFEKKCSGKRQVKGECNKWHNEEVHLYWENLAVYECFRLLIGVPCSNIALGTN